MSSGVDPNLPEPEAGTAGLKIVEEYGREYRRVSGTCNTPQFAAAEIPCPCRLFQLVAVACSRFGKTFDPKVAGSIPARPIRDACQASLFATWQGISDPPPLDLGKLRGTACGGTDEWETGRWRH